MSNICRTAGDVSREISRGAVPEIYGNFSLEIRLNYTFFVREGSPNLIVSDKACPTIIVTGSSQPNIYTSDDSEPIITSWDSSKPVIRVFGSSNPTIGVYNSSKPTVIPCGSNNPQIVYGGGYEDTPDKGATSLDVLLGDDL